MGTRHLIELTRPGVVQRLLIRGTNWLGDAVLMTPALSALRAAFPDAHLALLVKPVIGELFLGHPAVDEIILYRNPGVHAGWGGKWSLARALRKRRFDLAVLFQNAFEAALIAALAGIPNRYGYATDGRRFLLTHRIGQIPGLRQKHQVEYYLELLRPLGLPATPSAPSLRTTPAEDLTAMQQLRAYGIPSGRPVIGLNPGSSYGTAKRWPADRYANVAERLAREYGAHLLIFGGPGEEALGASISALMSGSHTVLSGRTTVRQLMALLKQCRLLITNDAGPMHVAKALGVPVVAIFGPTDPVTTAPFGIGYELVRRAVDCSPCLLRECPIDHRCMRGITPETVYAAAERQLRQAGPALRTNQNIGQNAEQAPVVYLDRDGTLNLDPGYLNNPEGMRLLPGVGSAIARLNKAGFKTVLVTNQSGVGRGLIRAEALDAIHERLRALLAESGAWLDGIYACPHRPEEACECRKPASGLVTRARRELALSSERSFVIGDRAIDMELARNIGARGIFVLSGKRPDDERELMTARGISPDYVARVLEEAVDWVLQSCLSPCG